MSSSVLRLRSLPLTFRLMAVLTVASFFVALLVTFLASERFLQERVVDQRSRIAGFAADLATRIAPPLALGDTLRLAMVASAAHDLAGHRVVVLDAEGVVQLDTGLLLGGSREELLARDGIVQRHFEQEDGQVRFETVVPVHHRGALAGDIRLQEPTASLQAAFRWEVFGISFLACLSLVAVACLMTHQWFARVRAATQALIGLAAGEVGNAPADDSTGELGALQQALAELDRGMNEGLHSVAEGVVAMATQMVDVLERRAASPPGHGERTARYAGMVAERLGLLPEDRRDIELAARIHDLGKMWVRPSLLHKSGPLDEGERQTLRQHPVRGADSLDCLPSLHRVAQVIRHHHEKYDGSGYPDGLRGDRIPLGARIVSICDAYDQLTSCTIDGATMTWPEALDQLRQDRGEHFDPWLLDLFEEEIRSNPIPARPDRPVMISTSGVVPYKLAELGEAVDDDWDQIDEGELELMLEESPPEEGA